MIGFLTAVCGASRGHRLESMFERMSAEIDSRVNAKVASNATKAIYSTQDHTGGVYVRNVDCWAASVDLTPISPWNSREGYARAGILVSPRHVICAHHFAVFTGTVFRFITADNQIVERHVVACLPTDENQPTIARDLQMCVLNADVPASIGFARVMSADMASYLTVRHTAAGKRLPLLVTDQEEKVLCIELYSDNDSAYFVSPAAGSQRETFHEGLIIYDSGSPFCAVLDGKLVLITVATGSGSGTSVATWMATLNSMIVSLGSSNGYRLTQI